MGVIADAKRNAENARMADELRAQENARRMQEAYDEGSNAVYRDIEARLAQRQQQEAEMQALAQRAMGMGLASSLNPSMGVLEAAPEVPLQGNTPEEVAFRRAIANRARQIQQDAAIQEQIRQQESV